MPRPNKPVIDLDDRDVGKAVAGAQEIRKWQVEKDKIMGVNHKSLVCLGIMLHVLCWQVSIPLVVSNIPSTAMNTAVVRMLESGIFGKNEVSKSLTDSEIKKNQSDLWRNGYEPCSNGKTNQARHYYTAKNIRHQGRNGMTRSLSLGKKITGSVLANICEYLGAYSNTRCQSHRKECR